MSAILVLLGWLRAVDNAGSVTSLLSGFDRDLENQASQMIWLYRSDCKKLNWLFESGSID